MLLHSGRMELYMKREAAYALLTKYNKNEALIRHALAVEGVMKYFARRFGEDEAYWGVVGLLHDIDYELYPDEHCKKAVELLTDGGADEALICAVCSHGWGICSDVEPKHQMEKVLYTIDELTGLIHAAALMRPSRSVMDIELSSVKKKFKDQKFAAGVSREVVTNGAVLVGLPLDEVITETIMGMRDVADDIGLGINQ